MNRLVLFTFAVLAGLFSNLRAVAEVSSASPEEARQASAAVFQLFEAKCNDCHGAHLEKPKGKFGYIMDFKKIAENEEMIIPGDPSKSEFFRLVNEDEMPGEKSDFPAATPAEKLALRRWIQIGAPAELPKEFEEKRLKFVENKSDPAAGNSHGGNSGHGVEGKAPKSFFAKLLSWFGRFHAASTHFPVGLLSVALLSELLGWMTKRPAWLICTRFLLVLGALSAVGTASLGWINDYAGASVIYSTHMWIGTATAAWAVLSAGCAVLFECREGTMERNRLRITVLIGALLVAGAGFLGGAITFGLDHYRW